MNNPHILHAWDTGGDTLTTFRPGEVPSYYRAEIPRAIPEVQERIEDVLQGASSQQKQEEL